MEHSNFENSLDVEYVKNKVNIYLKKRKFEAMPKGHHDSRNSQDLSSHYSQCLKSLVLSQTAQLKASAPGAVSLNRTSNSYQSYQEQYVRLRTRIESSRADIQEQLQSLLLPIFLHTYIQLVQGGLQSVAQEFWQQENERLVLETADQREMVEEVGKCLVIDQVTQNLTIKSLCQRCYQVPLSELAFYYLIHHLRENNNLYILELLRSKIDIHVGVPPGDLCDEVPATDEPSAEEAGESWLHSAIAAVRESALPLPNVCSYSCHGIPAHTCSTTLGRMTLIACGSEDCAIRLMSVCQPVPSEDVSPESRSRASTHQLLGHSGPIYALCPLNRDFLLSASEDATIRLWRLSAAESVALYRGHQYPIWALDVSHHDVFASSSADRQARVWLTEQIFPVRTLAGHEESVDVVKFHPNGNYVATGSSDKTIRMWCWQNAKTVRLLQGHEAAVMSLAFSPDGKHLASAGADCSVLLWDLGSGKLLRRFSEHTKCINTLAFTCDFLISGDLGGCVKIWDVHGSESAKPMENFQLRTAVHCLSLNKYNTLHIVCSSKDS